MIAHLMITWQAPGRLLQRVLFAAYQRQPPAFARQCLGHGPSHAAARAGDHCDFVHMLCWLPISASSAAYSYVLQRRIPLPTMLVQVRHLPASAVAAIVLLMACGGPVGVVSFGYLNDHFGRRITTVAYCLSATFLTACYLFIPMDSWTLALLGFPVSMAVNGVFAGVGPMLSELFPTAIRTTCMGFSYNVGKSIGALGVLAVGAVAEHAGLASSIAMFCFIGYFCALLALTFLPETRGRNLAHISGT
jgi:MFS family permease